MKQEYESEATGVQRLRERDLTYALVLKVPFASAEDLEAKVNTLFGELIVYQHWDTHKLYISRAPPED